jgi:hypothetical protein
LGFSTRGNGQANVTGSGVYGLPRRLVMDGQQDGAVGGGGRIHGRSGSVVMGKNVFMDDYSSIIH